MSVLSTSTTATPASSTTSSSASPSATPAFVFTPPGEMFTCGLSPIRWQYTGPSASLSINITNINITQQAPLSSSASTSPTSTSSGTTSTSVSVVRRGVKRQYSGYGGSYFPSINEPVGSGLDPTTLNYTWQGVNVPQGWYQLLATVQGVLQNSSSQFFVQNGTNVGCIPQFAVSSSTSRVPVSTSSSPSQSAVVAASSGHSHAGAIAGGVIGGIAFFAAALVAFLFWFLRRRRSRGAGNNNNGRRWSAMALKRSRHASEGRASTRKDPRHSGLPVLEADQTYIGSDEELSTVGHEKAIANSHTILPYDPSHPQAMRTSTQTTGSHSRVLSNPETPLRPPSYQPQGEVHPLERAHTIGNGPRRKPAPRYEEAGEIEAVRNGACSSTTTLESILGNNSRNSHGNGAGNSDPHALQHQSSFGAMRPMHVMMPDPPPAART
jgi:hypothetical protein